MYKRVIELGKDNPMSCLVKDMVFYATAVGILFLVDKYIVIEKKIIEQSLFAFTILFIATIIHKYVIDKIVGAGKLECPMETEEKTVQENVNMKRGLKEKKSEIPAIPEVNRHKQPEVPRQITPPQFISEDHLPIQMNQMNSPPPQYDMGGYGTLY